jgi:hypothetical protein
VPHRNDSELHLRDFGALPAFFPYQRRQAAREEAPRRPTHDDAYVALCSGDIAVTLTTTSHANHSSPETSDECATQCPREHRVFSGKIDKSKLGFAERAIIVAVRAPEGDFRRWDEIETWSRSIAATLHLEEAVT